MIKKLFCLLLLCSGIAGIAFGQTDKLFILDKTNPSTISRYTARQEMVRIPRQINGQEITAIGNGAFISKRTEIKHSVTGDKTTTTSYSSLDGVDLNRNIGSVIIPPNIRSVGSNAFGGNTLDSITIGSDVSLQDNSFPFGFAEFYNQNGKQAGRYTTDPNNYNGIRLYFEADYNFPPDWGTHGQMKWSFIPQESLVTEEFWKDLYYTISDSKITIIASEQGNAVTIPDEINGIPVTKIASGVFKDVTDITIGANVILEANSFDVPLFKKDYENGGRSAGTYRYVYDDVRDMWYREGSFSTKFKPFLGIGFRKSYVNIFEVSFDTGVELVTSAQFPWAIQADIGLGVGYMNGSVFMGRKFVFGDGMICMEYSLGGFGKFYFTKKIGIGFGGGIIGDLFSTILSAADNGEGGIYQVSSLPGETVERSDAFGYYIKPTWYIRGAFIFNGGMLFFDWYGNSTWGIGISGQI